MSRFVIVALLPKNIEESLNIIREFFEPGVSKKIPPHISISFPFFWGKREDLFTKVFSVSQNVSPLSIRITDIGIFDKETKDKIIYAKVSPEEALQNLFKILKNKVLQGVTFDTSDFLFGKLPGYVPHITLAMRASPEDISWVKTKLSPIFNFPILINELFILSQKKPKEQWKEEQSFKLKGF